MFVCPLCIEDAALGAFVQEHLVSNNCHYCGAESNSPIAASLDDVLDFIEEKINEEYDDANNLPHDSEDGFLLGKVLEASELFDEIGFGVENEELLRDITTHFSGEIFCERDHLILNPSDRVLSAWEQFKRVVKHERRYTFWTLYDDGEEKWHPDHLPPSHMLSEIAQIMDKMSPLVLLPKETEIWRARVHRSDSLLNSPSDFTSPPVDRARQPNRMSPAGIPMFYGCANQETAYVETVEPERLDGKAVSCACFAAAEPLNMLDLTLFPTIDSFFAVDRDTRHANRFLKEFAADLAKPIERDGRQHIGYVPTQVFTEYVRYELRTSAGSPIHGIKYQSSKNDSMCYVVFATQEACLPPNNTNHRQLLEFVERSIQTIDRHESLAGRAHRR